MLLLRASPAEAQMRENPEMGQLLPAPFSVDGTIGAFVGHGGANTGLHRGIAIDGIATWRARPAARGSVLLGFSATFQSSLANADVCEPAPGGGCVPRFPDIHAAGLLVGVERGVASRPTFRMLGGVARYADADDGHPALGIQGRIDLATATWRGMALVTSLRAAVVPRLRGEAYQFGALALGLRVE